MASEPVFHPAAEIVAIALKKICKVANSRKYSKLHEECRLFLDELHLIIPAAGTAGGTRLLVYGRSDTGSTTDLASQAAATAATSRRASVDGRTAAAAATPPPEAETPDTGTPRPAAGDDAQAGASGAPEDAAQQPAQDGATPAAEGQDAAAPATVPEAAAEAPSDAPAQPDASIAVAAPPVRPAAPPEPELPDLVPRTATALPDPVCDRILGIFRLAVDTQRPEVIEVALDCIQKLVAFRFMQVRG